MEKQFAMVPLAAFSDRRLTYRQLVVFGVICSFRQGSSDLSVCAGRDEIAERCGLHPSVISSATTDLEGYGWLQKSGRGGRAIKTVYRITIPETVTESDTVAHTATVSEPVTVTETVSKTVVEYATPLYRTEKSTDISAIKVASVDPAGFGECWSCYPKRDGGNNRSEALKAYRARLNAGALPADLLAGLKRYVAYCQAKNIVGTAFVKQAKSFFGPDDHWREAWGVSLGMPAGEAAMPDFMVAALRTNMEATHAD